MPTLSVFYGIVVYMFFYDNKKHQLPHLHASFGDDDAVFSIEDGDIIEGTLPRNKRKLVEAWKPFADQAIGVDMNKVVSVTPLEGKKLAIVFSDGKSGVFDVTPYIRSDFFKRLEDDSYFRQVGIFFSGIGWPEGQDLGPDTIEADLGPF